MPRSRLCSIVRTPGTGATTWAGLRPCRAPAHAPALHPRYNGATTRAAVPLGRPTDGGCAVARHGATWHREHAATQPAERAVPGTDRASAAPRLAWPAVARLVQRAVRVARGPQGAGAGRSRRSASGPGCAAASTRRRSGRSGQRSGTRQLVDAAGDAATAALTAVSAAADEAQARLAAKARMRELEHAVVTARAGGPVEVSPPTRDEALKLADRVDPGSSGASFVRGVGFILAGIVALAMIDHWRVRLAGRRRAGRHPHRRWLARGPSPDGDRSRKAGRSSSSSRAPASRRRT